MSAIGKRNLNLLITADVTFYDPALDSTRTVYWSNQSFLTNVDDSIAANRQYIGLLAQAFNINFSWFNEDQIGGRSERNYGELRAINPDGAHSLAYIFEDDLSVQGQSIVFRIGDIGDDLGDMFPILIQGREVRPSDDGAEVVIDLADAGQALDTSIFIDRFQGLGACVRHAPGVTSSVPDDPALDPYNAWYFDIAYRLPSWALLASGLEIASRPATGGGHVCRLELLSTGFLRVSSRTLAGATVALTTTDLEWVADGRWHRFIGKWDGAVLKAFHSTRTGGALSEDTAAIVTIQSGAGDLEWGDVGSTLDTHEEVDVAQVAFGVDSDVPTDAEILDRMKRPLTDAEIAACEGYWKLDERSGTSSTDETGNGHTATVPNNWQPTFEGRVELAGQAKPLAWGRVFNAPVVWADREEREGVVHARCFKGAVNAFEGAYSQWIGWPKYLFRNVDVDAATKTISWNTRSAGGAARLDAQPCFAGLVAGQKIDLISATNTDTFTLAADSTERTIVVAESILDATNEDIFITANDENGDPPDVQLWFDAGGVLYVAVPALPCSFELLGDIGAEIPTADPDTHFPEYTAAIMRCILRDWGGQSDIADNWDNGVDAPDDPAGAYFAPAGVWIDPAQDKTIREVLDAGADSIWARWGQKLTDGEWDLFVVSAPAGPATIELGALEILYLSREKSVPPIGGLTLRSTVNYRVLEEGEVAGVATAEDAAALRRQHLEGKPTLDATVLKSFPHAQTLPAVDTWLRYQADVTPEAQRRYDVLKVRRELYKDESILHGLDQNLLDVVVEITDAEFPTTASGKLFHMVELQAKDEEVTRREWG